MKDSYLRFNKSIIMLPAQIISYLDDLVDQPCTICAINSSMFIKAKLLTYNLVSGELLIKLADIETSKMLQEVGTLSVIFELHHIKFRAILKYINSDVVISTLPTVLFNGTVYQRDFERIECTNYELIYNDKTYSVNNISVSGLSIYGVLDCFINEKIEFKLKNTSTGGIEEKTAIIIHYTNDCTGLQLCQTLN